MNSPLKEVNFEVFKPQKPNFWFVKKDLTHQKEYEKGLKLTEMFNLNSNGFESQNDAITVHFTKEELVKIKNEILNTGQNDFYQKYSLKIKRDWIYEKAKNDLKNIENPTTIN